jgi:hypothetical protein
LSFLETISTSKEAEQYLGSTVATNAQGKQKCLEANIKVANYRKCYRSFGATSELSSAVK